MATENRPTAADLFCGAGGAACGAYAGGLDVRFGVDNDEDALQTYNENLPSEPVYHDLADVDVTALPHGAATVNWIHGSPPCQGFSLAGGASRDPDDERNRLVFRFVDWVETLRPRVVTMENVVGMTNISDHFMDRLMGAFRDAGYDPRWRILNAADFGVPQTRRRVITVAVRDDLPRPSRWFPRPTHAETPTTTLDGRELAEWVSVQEAIGDLPPVGEPLEDRSMTDQQNEAHQKAGRRPMSKTSTPANTIRTGTPSELQHTTNGVTGQDIWRGGGDPAHTIGSASAHYVRADGGAVNHVPQDHSEQTENKFLRVVRGEKSESMVTRHARLEKPAPTIAADTTPPIVGIRNHDVSADGDLDSARRLTVRECARLQSFPDWFVFTGHKTAQYAQVGNAVPPLLQYHIAQHVKQILKNDSNKD